MELIGHTDQPVETGEILVQVGVPLPVDGLFFYRAVHPYIRRVSPGVRVIVPYGKRRITGVVFRTGGVAPDGVMLKEIEEVLDDEPAFSLELLNLVEWVSSYYQACLGDVLSILLSHGRFIESRMMVKRGECFGYFRPSSEAEDRLRQALEKRGRITLRRAVENIGVTRSRLKKLEKEGFISILEASVKRGENVRKYQAFMLVDRNINSGDFSGDERDIIEFIRWRTIALSSELLAHYGGSGLKVVKNLVKKKVLQPVDLTRPLSESPGMDVKGPRATLTPEQLGAVDAVKKYIDENLFKTFLLHGVTGSGKTEVYLEVSKKVLEKGRSVILLFPEIALAGHLLARIKTALGKVAVLHSGLTRTERAEYFERILAGEFRVVIGVRSAVFAPVKNVGLIVVDEEHDTSYKQEDVVPYNARDVAVVRGKLENAVVLLGSATPSLESYHNAITGKYTRLSLTKRVRGAEPQNIEIVKLHPSHRRLFTPRLLGAVKEAVDRGRQVLLLAHRRGYSPFRICNGCGYVWKCSHCDVTLTYHKKKYAMQCHYCGYTEPGVSPCPLCRSSESNFRSFGTERVEEEVKELFPLLKVARLDSDVAARRGEADRILGKFERGEIDVLIGTQMVAKGLDIPRLDVIGVVSADTVFNIPDFRAPERGFQLLKQVLGRAGRREGGETRVIIQTSSPDNRIIRYIQESNDVAFYRDELARRETLGYPPFTRMVVITVSGTRAEYAEETAVKLVDDISTVAESRNVRVLGPSPSPYHYLRGRYRYQVILKCPTAPAMHRVLFKVRQFAGNINRKTVKLDIDVDPVSTL